MPLDRPYRLHRRLARVDREAVAVGGRPDAVAPDRRMATARSSAAVPVRRALPDPPPWRFEGLPRRVVLGREVPVATSLRARTLGLALLDRPGAGPGLLIPRCSAVHTFGMRFALDLCFLDTGGAVLGVRRAVPPRRFVSRRGAAMVLELPT